MDLQEMKNNLAKASAIVSLMNKIYEVEDEYLELWLQEGIADGSTLGEIVDEVADTDRYLELTYLAARLLNSRELEEIDEEEIY